MESGDETDFWGALDRLISSSAVTIDRPKGSHHPHYPELVYPLDYGYLAGTTSGDGAGIDVWVGANGSHALSALVLTADHFKRDAEIKLLLGCTREESRIILAFHNNSDSMRAMLVSRPNSGG
jgi:inorganic pyrophosphatase